MTGCDVQCFRPDFTNALNRIAFKVGQRNTAERLQGVALQDLRVYTRALAGPETGQLAHSTFVADVLAKAADKRTAKEKDELYDWWLVTFDKPYQDLSANVAALASAFSTPKKFGRPTFSLPLRPPALSFFRSAVSVMLTSTVTMSPTCAARCEARTLDLNNRVITGI